MVRECNSRPDYFTSDCSNLVELRKSLGETFAKKHGVKLGFMSPFVKASAYALLDQPVVNAVIDGPEIVYRDYVDISVAVATPKASRELCGLENGYCVSATKVNQMAP